MRICSPLLLALAGAIAAADPTATTYSIQVLPQLPGYDENAGDYFYTECASPNGQNVVYTHRNNSQTVATHLWRLNTVTSGDADGAMVRLTQSAAITYSAHSTNRDLYIEDVNDNGQVMGNLENEVDDAPSYLLRGLTAGATPSLITSGALGYNDVMDSNGTCYGIFFPSGTFNADDWSPARPYKMLSGSTTPVRLLAAGSTYDNAPGEVVGVSPGGRYVFFVHYPDFATSGGDRGSLIRLDTSNTSYTTVDLAPLWATSIGTDYPRVNKVYALDDGRSIVELCDSTWDSRVAYYWAGSGTPTALPHFADGITRNSIDIESFVVADGITVASGVAWNYAAGNQDENRPYLWKVGASEPVDPSEMVPVDYMNDVDFDDDIYAHQGEYYIGSNGLLHAGIYDAGTGNMRPAVLVPRPAVSVAIEQTTITEGAADAVVDLTISREDNIAKLWPLTVSIGFSGTATIGNDFTLPHSLSSGVYTATIPAGSLSTTVPITVINRTTWHADRTLSMLVMPVTPINSAATLAPAQNYTVDAAHDDVALTIHDDAAPSNPSVTITRDASPSVVNVANHTVAITTTFSESVTGFTDGELTASLGSMSALGGSGTTYTATWSAPMGGQGTAQLNVAAGVASGASDTNLAATALSIVFDTLAPVAPAVTVPTAGATVGGNVAVSGTISSEIAQPVIAVTVGSVTTNATVTSAGGNNWNWTAIVTGLSNGTAAVSAVATDSAGNPGTTSTPFNITVDASPPVLTVTAPASPTNDPTPTLSGTQDDASATIMVTEGATTLAIVPNAGTNWTATLSQLADGVHNLTVSATDTLGNASTQNTAVTVDTAGPTATFAAPSASIAKGSSTITIEVDWSDLSQFQNISTATGNVLVNTLTGDASATVVSVTDVGSSRKLITLGSFTGNGTLAVACTAGTAVDVLSQASALTGNSATITVDTTAPTVTLASATPATTAANPIPVTLTFSEAVTGLTAGDFTVVNGTAQNVAGSGTAWTVDIVPSAAGNVDVTLAAAAVQDTAGNDSTVSATLSRTVETAPVTVALALAAGQAATSTGTEIRLTATFSEAIDAATFTAADVTLGGTAGGTLAAAVAANAGSSTVFTITITGMSTTDGTVTARIGADLVASAAGAKPNSASGTASVAWSVPHGGSGGSSSSGGGGGGCGMGGMAGLLLGALMFVGLRRRR